MMFSLLYAIYEIQCTFYLNSIGNKKMTSGKVFFNNELKKAYVFYPVFPIDAMLYCAASYCRNTLQPKDVKDSEH